jgi:hypothetical protein
LTSNDSIAIVRAVKKLSIDKIVANKRKQTECLEELDRLNKSLDFFRQDWPHEDSDKKERMIEQVSKDIIKVEEQLSKTVHMPSIAELKRSDYNSLADDLETLLIHTVKYFDVTTENIAHNSRIIAVEILETFPNLTLEDVMLCFQNAKDGLYGQLYNRIDGLVIKKWLHEYQLEKQKAIIRISEVDEIQHKEIKRTISEEVSYRAVPPRRIRDEAERTGLNVPGLRKKAGKKQ